jgi:hypothetical protein
VLRSGLSKDELISIIEREQKRDWNIFIAQSMSKTTFVNYAGRYIRRPPIAQRRLTRNTDQEVRYLAKDTRAGQLVPVKYTNEAFVALLKPHVADRYRHSMRYFGLLAPRSRSRLFAVFVLLRQKKRPRPLRLGWADSLFKKFGKDPLIDSGGQPMHWIGRLSPVHR